MAFASGIAAGVAPLGQRVRWWLPVTAPPGEMQLQRQMQFTVTAPPVKMQFRNARRRF